MELRSLKRRQRKRAVRELLGAQNLTELLEWASEDGRVVEMLSAHLYETDDLLRWRAIEALGRVASSLADTDIDAVRDMLRRLLWSMTDESGGTAWHAPEAIGAILLNVPPLIDEFGPILGSFLDEEPFERGAHWAVSRIAALQSGIFVDRVDELVASLQAADPFIRAHAASALEALGADSAIRSTAGLLDDEAAVVLYNIQTGHLDETTVGKVARSALKLAG